MTIYEAIAKIMEEGYSVSKNNTNVTQGFKYRGIDDVMNTFYPLLSKYGVFVVPEVMDVVREERQTPRGGNLLYSILKIKYTFYSADGSSVSAVVIGEGMDSGDKASNKALAVGMKYALFQTFCIPTDDMKDPDEESHEVKPKEQEKKTEKAKTDVKKSEAPKTTPKAEAPKPEGNTNLFVCDECNNVIMPHTHNGVEYAARRIATASKTAFGKQMCWDCYAKAKEAQK